MIKIKQSINDPDKLIVSGLQTDSRLQMFNILKDTDNEFYLNIFKNYTLPDSISDNEDFFDTYIVDNDDWWDNMSSHFYDASTLWWVICFVNNIKNPFEEIYPGMTVRIFKKEYYNEIIKQLREIFKL